MNVFQLGKQGKAGKIPMCCQGSSCSHVQIKIEHEKLDVLLVGLVTNNHLEAVDTETYNHKANSTTQFLKYTASHISEALKSVNNHYYFL